MVLRASAAVLLALCACQPPPPDSPTWFGEVQPIMMANCARCHGADPEQPQIAGFRLDRYVKNDAATVDAYDYQQLIARSAVDRRAPVMPPTYALTDRQRRTLERWVELGGPKGQRDNQSPLVERIAPVEASITVDQSLAVTIRSSDADGDGLVVRVGIREIGAPPAGELITTGGGQRVVAMDTGILASGRTYEVFAILDDGHSDDPEANAHEVVVLPQLFVDHGGRGTAPTVRLIRPNGQQTVMGTTEIAWEASDPDPGDVLSINLELWELGTNGSWAFVRTIAANLPNDPPATYSWNTAEVPTTRGGQPILYKVRVVARDAGNQNVRSDDSDAAFTIAEGGATTTYTWADVKPILDENCVQCHGQPAQMPILESFRLDKYDAEDPVAPLNSDVGVYEMRDRVYQRMVVWQNMPPANEVEQPTAAEIEIVRDWILGGAPRTPNAPPTFSWTVPNNAAVTATTTGNVTLTWTASDPEGALQGGSISYKVIAATADHLAACDGTGTWTEIAGADVTAGTHAFTAPSTGYFCFRGQVTDAANQTTTAIALKPVKYSTAPGP